jgi:hypothetical protein
MPGEGRWGRTKDDRTSQSQKQVGLGRITSDCALRISGMNCSQEISQPTHWKKALLSPSMLVQALERSM